MKRFTSAVLYLIVLAMPVMAAETWTDVSLVDIMCSTKAKADPDSHSRQCALQCQGGGFGILTGDGAFLKLDDAGNRKAIEALNTTDKKDHLRVKVTGAREGDTIKVQSISF